MTKSRWQLKAHESKHVFITRNSPTLAYNEESYLGPTILYHRGDKVHLSVKNELETTTTLHQHGLIVPDYADGTMKQSIGINDTWNVAYTIDQGAGTFLYHPHKMGKTALQVYHGLAGMIIIEDEVSNSLNIPNTYGINDIPLIIQNRVLTKTGKLKYKQSMHTSRMGYVGNTILVNGNREPTFTPTENIIRFRILNGSNFGVHTYTFKDISAYLIANGASFLDYPK